ncbi:MAG: DUF1501 domain-containing protein [Planctomycetota bacterium]|nr:MAG: DUF1501 domain-containing protein [Planctomycetota bacterium]REJ96654.1 MAG: DUF1501 domain-containing protein [Planctomycetota bacterium]REK23273.1 MAG: DUF1501 domain-containing protein [Planctomycetota bacterium]REK30805.1 MAG: DUF1501 domain-containing protein [Planctomycetota bacterium]
MPLCLHEAVSLRPRLTRRRFLYSASAGIAAAGALNFRDLMSLQAADLRREGRAMILLWMAGGPSQFETFDPKPDHENGGPTEAIDTSVPGIRIAQGWEQTAKVMDEIALIRSMTNREGNHQRASYQLHTGYVPSGSVKHPSFASAVSQELADPDIDLPAFVSVGPTIGAGFLGVDYEPFVVNNPGQLPQNVATTVPGDRYERRLGLLDRLEDEFAGRGAEAVVKSHKRLYGKTSQLVLSDQTKAFDFSEEPQALQDRYGDNQFGKGCLLARRLVEAGVTFVEVRSNGWDTHQDNFERTGGLAAQVDPAMGTLIADLKDRGLLERTIVVWMGEFGRTPRVNPRTGRDHYPRAFNVALAGGGVRGGQVIGATTDDGAQVADRPVAVGDLFASVCQSLQVDPNHENISPLGRPMRIVDKGAVIDELFA